MRFFNLYSKMINEINSKIVFAIRCSDTPAVVIRQKEIEKCFFENGYAHIKELTLYQQNTNQSSQCRCQSGCTQTYIYSLIKRLKNNIFDSVVELRHQLQKSANNVGLILFSDIPYLSLLYLQHYSRKNNVMLLYDCYDWYSSETVTRHLFSSLESCYIQIMNTLFRQSIIRSDVKVIVVSTYLQNYFERRGKATLRIPITLETETIHPDAINKENHKMTIVYAGNPGKRDNLGIVIEAISKLNVNEQEMIQFIIAGIDTKHLAQLLTYDESTLSSLPYLGILGRVR